jgi:mono/diheme cytochrome c family protein
MSIAKKLVVLIGITILLFVPLWVTAEDYRLPSNPVKGSRLFISKGCIKCHAIKGEGGTIGPDLGKVNIGGSLLDMAGIMWNHAPYMERMMKREKITWPVFSGEEMASVIAYLYFVNYFDEPGDPAVGKALFENKGCIKCHNINGKGGKIGPSLDKFHRDASPIVITQAMWNHGPKMSAKMKQLGIKPPQFQGRQIIDLVAYIRSQAKGKGKEEPAYMLPGNPQEGRKLFVAKNCVKCHAVRGEGGKIGPDLGERSMELYRSVTQVAGIMWNHGSVMWSKMKEKGIEIPKFSGKEMADLIAYLYFIRYFDEPGDPVKGPRLFSERWCIKCHAIRGEGGKVGPDLSKVKGISSPIDLAAKMWNHVPIIYKQTVKQQIPWPQFQKGEMANILGYLEAIRETTK